MIALINSLKQFHSDAFKKANNTQIEGAFAVVNGEPMNFLDDDTPVA